ncbi:MAG: cupredoxin domain-containing protein [Bacteroidota bacterium]
MAALLAGAAVVLPLAAKGREVAKISAPTVVIEGTTYEPQTLTVKRGETVVWINRDPFPHTVTAAGVFDSRPIAAGRSWKYEARRRGEFPYLCTLHPNMKGILRVE